MLNFVNTHSDKFDKYDIRPLYNIVYRKLFEEQTGILAEIEKNSGNNIKYPVINYHSTSTAPRINLDITPNENAERIEFYLNRKGIPLSDYIKVCKYKYLLQYLRIEETGKVQCEGIRYLLEFIQYETDTPETKPDYIEFMDANNVQYSTPKAQRFIYKNTNLQIFKNGNIQITGTNAEKILKELRRLKALHEKIKYI